MRGVGGGRRGVVHKDRESALAFQCALRLRIERPEEIGGLLQTARERANEAKVFACRRRYQLGLPWDFFEVAAVEPQK